MAVKKLGFNILKSKIWNLIKLYGIIEWVLVFRFVGRISLSCNFSGQFY